MNRASSIQIGLVVFCLAVWAALGFRHDVTVLTELPSLGKALAVGAVSGYLAAGAALALSQISAARRGLQEMNSAFHSAVGLAWFDSSADAGPARPNHPRLVATQEITRRRLKLGTDVRVSELVASREVDRLIGEISEPRQFGTMAVYIGLGGTLLGLTIAISALSGISNDAQQIKDQILSVVSGFGGSFFAALTGVIATILVGRAVARYDQESLDAGESIERYLAEEFIPTLDNRNEFAETVATAVNDAMRAGFSEFGLVLLNIVRNAEGTVQASSDAAEKLHIASEELRATAGKVVGAGASLNSLTNQAATIVAQLEPSISAFRDQLTLLQSTSDRMEPLFIAAKDISITLVESDRRLVRFTDGVDGFIAKFRDELTLGHQRIEGSLEKQTAALDQLVQGTLNTLADLQAAVSEYSELVRDLPISIPATRLITDLEEVGVKRKLEQARDSEALLKAQQRLSEAEANIGNMLVRLEEAHASIKNDVSGLGNQTRNTKAQLAEIEEILNRPIWQRLRGRKPT